MALGCIAHAATNAELVVDLETNRILHARDIDDRLRPASLAKLMTAYVAFAALRDGTVAMGTRYATSAHAASQLPVRAGLTSGTRYQFSELLNATIIRSGNDAAVAVAEAVAGSEASFVERMNATARSLRLVNTRFANPSGLPAPDAFTSARDVALLARAILRDFPRRKALFGQASIQLAGKTIRGHNRWLGSYAGADGMKTGFTCRAGYHLAATATRDGRELLTVVMGARSLDERLARAVALTNLGMRVQSGSLQALAHGAASSRPVKTEVIARACTDPTYVRGSGRGPSRWSVALEVFADRPEAVARARAFSRSYARGARLYLTPRLTSKTAYQAGVTGISQSAATRACLEARKSGWHCVVQSPETANMLWKRAHQALRMMKKIRRAVR